jgi:hypothetical protein
MQVAKSSRLRPDVTVRVRSATKKAELSEPAGKVVPEHAMKMHGEGR